MQKIIIVFTLFSAVLFGLHYGITEMFFSGMFFYQLWQIHAFFVISTLLVITLLNVIHKTFPDKTGFAFMALSIVKMALSIVFLYPLLKADLPQPEADVLNFFIAYFLYLAFEAVSAVRLINTA